MQLVDLSVHLEFSESEPEPVRVETVDHRCGAELLTRGSKVVPDDFPEGLAVNLERIVLTSHSGTHVDAPFHYGPLCQGKQSKKIDEIPLDWCFGRALVIDCSKSSQQTIISLDEIQDALGEQELDIMPNDIVLLYTGADRLWGSKEYFTSYRGMSSLATEWILDRGVRVIGIDSYGFDRPFHLMLENYTEARDSDSLWPCHMLGRRREYCQIERLSNLKALPLKKKFQLSCFPIKLKGCGAAPARVVAMIEDE